MFTLMSHIVFNEECSRLITTNKFHCCTTVDQGEPDDREEFCTCWRRRRRKDCTAIKPVVDESLIRFYRKTCIEGILSRKMSINLMILTMVVSFVLLPSNDRLSRSWLMISRISPRRSVRRRFSHELIVHMFPSCLHIWPFADIAFCIFI